MHARVALDCRQGGDKLFAPSCAVSGLSLVSNWDVQRKQPALAQNGPCLRSYTCDGDIGVPGIVPGAQEDRRRLRRCHDDEEPLFSCEELCDRRTCALEGHAGDFLAQDAAALERILQPTPANQIRQRHVLFTDAGCIAQALLLPLLRRR